MPTYLSPGVYVEDVEAGPQPCHLGLDAELAGAQAVERAGPTRRRLITERRPDAPSHLARGFVGEGDRQDAGSRDASDRDPVPARGALGPSKAATPSGNIVA